MGTPFDRVEDLATRKVNDWKLGKIYNQSLEGYKTWCDGFLINAIPNFANDCWQSLEYDEEAREFVSDLTVTEIDILVCFWVLEWWEREANDSAQNAAKLQTSSFTTHSPAQHMKEEQVIISTKREATYQKITDYLLQDLDKIGGL